MKYGVHWTARIGEAAEIGNAARQAEELGFQSFGLPDHLITSRPLIDPFVGLTAAAEATSTIKLSTMVILSGLRRSVQLARDAASLQALSNNRLELGIGAGWVQKEKDALNRWSGTTPFQRIKEDLGLLDCAFPDSRLPQADCADPDHAIAKSICSGSQRPDIMVAAGGPKMLDLAAQIGDIVMLTVPTDRRLTGEKPSTELLRSQVETVRGAANGAIPEIQFQIREYGPGQKQSDDLWILKGERGEIADRIAALEAAGIGYISLCTSGLNVMEEFAHDIF